MTEVTTRNYFPLPSPIAFKPAILYPTLYSQQQSLITMRWTWCSQTQAFLQNATIKANMCPPPDPTPMTDVSDPLWPTICPNPDISGIGVRIAFYFQSLINSKSTISTLRPRRNAICEYGYKKTVVKSKEFGARIVVVSCFYTIVS